MPRSPKAAPPKPNSIVASAAQVTARRRKNVPSTQAAGWQEETWQMLDDVGELEFYREWKSKAMSRVSLYVVEVQADGSEKRVTAGLPKDALDALFDGEQGQAQMMGALEGHIALVGESWLVGLLQPSPDPSIDTWRVLSKDELEWRGSKLLIDRGDGEPESYEGGDPEKGIEPEVWVTRIWNPHPRKYVQAHSSVRPALPIFRELLGLTAHIAASIDSRLAGAGILFVPQEMTFTTPLPGEEPDPDGADPFMVALTDAMSAARADRGNAAAMVPIIVKAPAEYLDAIKHITFWSEFAGEALELRKEAITRAAASLDIPAEVLTGMADVNHWTGWLLDDNSVKMHVEPDAELLVHALTTRYLWPCLQGDAETFDTELRRFQLRADTSDLRGRPNRSAEAAEGHSAMVLTDAAYARERGFESEDLLSDPANVEELKRRLLLQAARGVQTADLTAAALAQLGIDLAPKASEVADTPGVSAEQVPGPVDPPPAELDGPAPAVPAQGPPPAPTEQAAALILGSEAVTLRALERARNKGGRRRGGNTLGADQLDACLSGAWEYLPRVAAMTGVDHDQLRARLDGYARRVLVTGEEHDPVAFALMLTKELERV